MYNIQVEKEHYLFSRYVNIYRWIQYYYQLEYVCNLSNRLGKEKFSILLVGVGDGIVSTVLKMHGHKVQTLDIDEELNPDFVATLPNLPSSLTAKKFDIIIACEVLEHIRYKDSIKTIKIFSKMCKFSLISLPHKSFYISLILKIAKINNPFSLLLSVPTRFIKHRFDGEHYWELGTMNYSTKRFIADVRKSNFTVVKNYRMRENPYSHFFHLNSEIVQ